MGSVGACAVVGKTIIVPPKCCKKASSSPGFGLSRCCQAQEVATAELPPPEMPPDLGHCVTTSQISKSSCGPAVPRQLLILRGNGADIGQSLGLHLAALRFIYISQGPSSSLRLRRPVFYS